MDLPPFLGRGVGVGGGVCNKNCSENKKIKSEIEVIHLPAKIMGVFSINPYIFHLKQDFF